MYIFLFLICFFTAESVNVTKTEPKPVQKEEKVETIKAVEQKDDQVKDEPVVVPPVPKFLEIEESIYLDDKLTKLGKKAKRPVEISVE